MTINTNSRGWVLPIYMSNAVASNSLCILTHSNEFVKNYFIKGLVTHTGFEPMLTA